MDSSVSPKDEIWFLRVCHHISTGLYLILMPVIIYFITQEPLNHNLSNLDFTFLQHNLSMIMDWTSIPVSKIDFPLRFPNPSILRYLLLSQCTLYNCLIFYIISHLFSTVPWRKIASYMARQGIFLFYRTRTMFWCGWIQSTSSYSISLRSVTSSVLY